MANVHDPHNVSAVYRSCDAFGVAQVHLYYTDTPFPHLGEKTSASARKWVETVRHQTREDLVSSLKSQGMQILATACSPDARPMRTWDLTRPTAIIMGNEHRGVDPELAEIADGEIYIPMHGMIQSFNISVAAAILLSEASRQREDAGMYSSPTYSQAEYDEKLALWLQK